MNGRSRFFRDVVIQTAAGCTKPGTMATFESTRILFLAASPKREKIRLEVEREFQALQDALDRVPGVEIQPVFFATGERLHDKLIRSNPHIVHLAAHGGASGAELEDDGSGWDGLLPGRVLEQLLRDEPELCCVVLNACYSANWFSETLGPALILMNNEVGDAAAIAFSKGFYTALGAGKGLPEAFEEGKRRVALLAPNEPFEPTFLPECRGVIGIRTREHYNHLARDRCLFFRDLEPLFGGRANTDPALDWTSLDADLREFLTGSELLRSLEGDGDHLIYLDCPATLALLAGRVLGPRAPVYPFHRVGPKRTVWKPDRARPLGSSSPWDPAPKQIVPGATKLVISLSVANDTRDDVEREVARSGEPTSWVDLRPAGGGHQYSVRDADHAYDLARWLPGELRRLLRELGPAPIHLFVSTPGPLLFFLGQQGAAFPSVQMYEFDLQTRTYSPSLMIE